MWWLLVSAIFCGELSLYSFYLHKPGMGVLCLLVGLFHIGLTAWMKWDKRKGGV